MAPEKSAGAILSTVIEHLKGGNSSLQDKRYLAKVDWNIADNHRASFTYSQTKEQKPIITGSTTKLMGVPSPRLEVILI